MVNVGKYTMTMDGMSFVQWCLDKMFQTYQPKWWLLMVRWIRKKWTPSQQYWIFSQPPPYQLQWKVRVSKDPVYTLTKTKQRIVFRIIHVKDPLQIGKVWLLDFLGIDNLLHNYLMYRRARTRSEFLNILGTGHWSWLGIPSRFFPVTRLLKVRVKWPFESFLWPPFGWPHLSLAKNCFGESLPWKSSRPNNKEWPFGWFLQRIPHEPNGQAVWLTWTPWVSSKNSSSGFRYKQTDHQKAPEAKIHTDTHNQSRHHQMGWIAFDETPCESRLEYSKPVGGSRVLTYIGCPAVWEECLVLFAEAFTVYEINDTHHRVSFSFCKVTCAVTCCFFWGGAKLMIHQLLKTNRSIWHQDLHTNTRKKKKNIYIYTVQIPFAGEFLFRSVFCITNFNTKRKPPSRLLF